MALVGVAAVLGEAPVSYGAFAGAFEQEQVVPLSAFEVVADRLPAADNSEIEARRLASPEPFAGVTRAEFERRANRRAGDIVARLPGVFMGGPPGENKDARLRGLDKEFSRTQVDGWQLPDGGEKRELQLNRVPADLVQEVRVLRNPSPEFESDGMAGRLDLRLRPLPERAAVGEARVAGGGRSGTGESRWAASALFGGRPTPRFGALVSFTYLDDPTDKSKHEEEFAPTGGLRKVKAEAERNRTTARDFFGSFGWSLPHGELALRPLRLQIAEDRTKEKRERDLTRPAASDEAREFETERKTKLGEGLALTYVQRWSAEGRAMDARVAWQRLREAKPGKFTEVWRERGGVFETDRLREEHERKGDRTVAADAKFTVPLDADGVHVLKVGWAVRARDRFRDKTAIERRAPAFAPMAATGPKDTYFLDEIYWAVFVQDIWRVTPGLTALYGARFERVDLSTRTRTEADVAARFDDFNPALQMAWRARPDTAVKFAVSRALNRPKFDELSPYEQDTPNRIVIGNPRLQPARAWKADWGVDFARRDAFWAANVFAKQIDGLIESVETGEVRDGKPVVQVLNVGDGWVRGVELEQRLGLKWTEVTALQGLTFWTNQTWLRSELTEAATGRVRPFSGQPRFLANAGFDYELGRFYLTVSARHVGRRSADDASAETKVQRAENPVDAALHVQVARGLSAFVEANNLTSAGKEEITTRTDGTRIVKTERTGRAWFGGLRYVY